MLNSESRTVQYSLAFTVTAGSESFPGVRQGSVLSLSTFNGFINLIIINREEAQLSNH
jgi:hypothetical protein